MSDPNLGTSLNGGPPCPQDQSTDTQCMWDEYVIDDNLVQIEVHHMHCNTDGFEWTITEPVPTVQPVESPPAV